MKKVNKNLVDRYCLLRAEITELSEVEKVLRPKIMSEFEAVGVSELAGHNGYSVKRIVSNSYTVNPMALFKKLIVRDFVKCVTVQIKKAEDFLSRDDILKMSKTALKVSLKVQL